MAPFKTHLTVLADSARRYPSLPAFRTPVIDNEAGSVQKWNVITYSQFQHDVELYARHWTRTLTATGLPRRSVVGLWLGGLTYADLALIYGIARAGYIPQLFSLKLPNPAVIYELLAKSRARTLIYDAAYAPSLTGCPVPTHAVADISADAQNVPLPSLTELSAVKASDTVMIFHTSGSTSGSPKLIPCSYSWLETIIAKAGQVSAPIRTAGQDVTVWMGSVCHIGQTFMLLGSLQHGACTIQPTQIAFSPAELLDMCTRCRLNRLNQFPAFLHVHLAASRTDAAVLAALRGLDEILYSGQPLPSADEEWMYAHDMQVTNLFGSTECGAMLLSRRGGARPCPPLRPMDGVKYAFLPVADGPSAGGAPARADASGYQNAHAPSAFRELVILADSGDCPDASLRAPDGHYHTGDLFVEVAPGAWVGRGRNDDWIKSASALRCDTRAIEENVRATCGALVSECVVVGSGRPSPALFVEAREGGGQVDAEKLKKEIIRRTRHFHARRYLHERITSTKVVVVVPAGTLPRTATKGNIRRKAVEDMFSSELDRMFAA
ncbi:acetyl-CoA synthetase-like protein [Wolfiporia cocos MD-104 SS10]|uniref:Acetyl-CoA synthetase-like protein n=1 Tax=Wolfiporia cocos (strain MD-104) TaxID=742152 RepID=A0A2H3J8L7_WOLCO|nr:acetyl-CoA synthetase-like protein [Wolfiporia cocos MD-104 SS10]